MQSLIPIDEKSAPTENRGHIQALDGLRGLAVLLVFLRHASLLWTGSQSTNMASLCRVLAFGQVGVDLFFVLSGFLITGILLKTVHGQQYWQTFITHRALRIFPLYYGLLVVALLGSVVFPNSAMGHLCPQSKQWFLWLFVSYTSQERLANPLGYFDHFWSLAVEIQFYLLWAAVIACFDMPTVRRICIALCIAAPLLRAYCCFTHAYMASYVLLPCRLDALTVGALVAICYRDGELPSMASAARCEFGWWLILLPVFCVAAASNQSVMLIWAPSVFSAFFATLLILALCHPRVRHCLEAPALRSLGRYSYGFYAFHYIVIRLLVASKLQLSNSIPVLSFCCEIFVAFIVTLALSAFSFHVYEQPFLRLKRRA